MTTKESSCGKILPTNCQFFYYMPFRSSPTMFPFFFLETSFEVSEANFKYLQPLSNSVSFPSRSEYILYYYCAVDKHTIEIREVIHTYCTWWYPNKPSPITLTILDSGSSTVFLLGCGGAHYATILDSLFLLGDEKNTLTKKLFTLYTPLFLQ